MKYLVTVSHDAKEGVWYVQDSEVPGLNAEAATFDALVEILSELAPDLVNANLPEAAATDEQIHLCVQHVVNARPADAA